MTVITELQVQDYREMYPLKSDNIIGDETSADQSQGDNVQGRGETTTQHSPSLFYYLQGRWIGRIAMNDREC